MRMVKDLVRLRLNANERVGREMCVCVYVYMCVVRVCVRARRESRNMICLKRNFGFALSFLIIFQREKRVVVVTDPKGISKFFYSF